MSCVLAFASGEHSLLSGTVLHREEDRLLVQCPSGVLRASRAASCLLQPDQHDTVLLAIPENGTVWVLAVLMRQGESAVLNLPAHSTVQAEAMTLRSEHILCAADTLDMRAGHIGMQASVFSISGQMLLRQVRHICTAARNLWDYCNRKESTCEERREVTKGLAQKTAGRLRVTVRSSWRVRAERANLQAKEHLLIDAEHIKIG